MAINKRAQAAAKSKREPIVKEAIAPKRMKRQKLDVAEIEEIIHYLALTDSITETARCTGTSKAVVHSLKHENMDQVLMQRASFQIELGHQFTASIQEMHTKTREILGWMKDAAAARDLAPTLLVLAKATAIHAERRQVLSGAPGTIGEMRGQVPGADMEEVAKRDRAYLKTLFGGNLPPGMAVGGGDDEDVDGDDGSD